MNGMPPINPPDAGMMDSGDQVPMDSGLTFDSGTVIESDAGSVGLDARTSTQTGGSSRPRRVTRADDEACGCQSTHLHSTKSVTVTMLFLVILFWRRRLSSLV